MIGGYGNYRFKNSIKKYDFINNTWENFEYVTIDSFDYRTNAVIIAKDNKTMFIYGGSGNKKGHQKFGKNQLYDLWQFNFENKKLEKLNNNIFPNNYVPFKNIVQGIYIDGFIYFLATKNEFKNDIDIWKYDISDTLKGKLIKNLKTDHKIINNSIRYDSNNDLITFLQIQKDAHKDIIHTSGILLPIDNSKKADSYQNKFIIIVIIVISLIIIVYLVLKKNSETSKNNINDDFQLEIKSIEPFEIFIDGKIIDFNKSKRPGLMIDLLKVLISSKNYTVTHKDLKKAVWPDVQEKSFINSLNVALSALRKLLGPYGKKLKQKNKVLSLDLKIKK